MKYRVFFFGLFLLVSYQTHLFTPVPCEAQGLSGFSQNPHIQNGLNFYNDQKYEEATKAFQKAINWNKTTKQDRTTALQYLGFIAVILGQQEQAQNYFLTLLKMDPNFRVDEVVNPPKFVNFFKTVLKYYQEQRTIKIESLTPEEVPTNKPLVVQLRVRDTLHRMNRLELFYRLENGPRYFRRDVQETQPTQPAVQPTTPPPAVQPTAPPVVQPPPAVQPPTREVPKPSVPATPTPERQAPVPTTPPATRESKPTNSPATPTRTAPGSSATQTPEKRETTTTSPASRTAPTTQREETPKNQVKGTKPMTDRFFSYEVPSLLFASQTDTTQAYYFEYYVVAYDSNNQVVATLGSAEKPVRVKRIYIKEEPKGPVVVSTPFYKTWWFWTITGVAVAGITAAIVIPIVIRNQVPPAPGSGEAIITIVK